MNTTMQLLVSSICLNRMDKVSENKNGMKRWMAVYRPQRGNFLTAGVQDERTLIVLSSWPTSGRLNAG